MKLVNILFFFLFAQTAIGQNIVLIEANYKHLQVDILYSYINNRCYLYDRITKKRIINFKIIQDSNFKITKYKNGLVNIVPLKHDFSKSISIQLGEKKIDSINAVCMNYFFPISIQKNYRGDRVAVPIDLDFCGLHIEKEYDQVNIKRLKKKFKILSYIIELEREKTIVKTVSVNNGKLENKEVKELKKNIKDGDNIIARNVRVKSNLGYIYTIKNRFLRNIRFR